MDPNPNRWGNSKGCSVSLAGIGIGGVGQLISLIPFLSGFGYVVAYIGAGFFVLGLVWWFVDV